MSVAAANPSVLPDSSFDSPQRSGRHVPLRNDRDGMLTGVATASDSRADVSNPYFDESGRASPIRRNHGTASPNPGTYSPGSRSLSAQRGDGFETQTPGDVPMQSFQDGLPPPPPIQHSWGRIDKWAEENYPELFDQLGEGATANDMNELEHQLDCTLPQDVRDSLMIHDGQERGGTPTGIIFGSMLMDCEEIVQEWEQWRRVNEQYLLDAAANRPPPPPVRTSTNGAGSSEASSSKQRPSSSSSQNDEWRQNLLSKQQCVPPNAVKKAYAHNAWIPLVRDWGGNNLAVDLSPGPAGKWGQIILFGRDYDTKYVIARSWSAFLALVADDLNSGKWFVDEETSELKLREFRDSRVEPPYFSILRWRMDQKYGRRGPSSNKRKSVISPKAGSPLGSRSASPYTNPADANGDARGRSMQRLSQSSPLTSPMRRGYNKAPLSKVTEEGLLPELRSAIIEPSKLVEVETPRVSEDDKDASRISLSSPGENDLLRSDKENVTPRSNGKKIGNDDAMKTIEI